MSTPSTDHIGNGSVELAAQWLGATLRRDIPGPVVPTLREKFGLDNQEAIEAIRLANLARARAI